MFGELTVLLFFFFFKQKTAYEMRISDWSSDVCSSDLFSDAGAVAGFLQRLSADPRLEGFLRAVLYIEQPIHRTRALTEPLGRLADDRSEERRVGKECVSTCRSRWSPYN